MDSKYYLSIVATTRNDGYSGKLVRRIKLFVSSLSYQLSQKKISSEIIIVEWNPPSNTKSIAKVLSQLELRKSKQCLIKVIVVPKKIHKSFSNSDKLGIFQFIAKNVGIRRAQGKFILSTNIDILFSEKVLDFISAKKLKKNIFLRAIRFDVPDKISFTWRQDKRIQYCLDNYFRLFWPWGEQLVQNTNINNLIVRYKFFRYQLSKYFSDNKVFTNACGDFTLMYRDDWFKLRGYPEFPVHGVKIDSLLCYQAYFSGLKEKILDENHPIFHVDHPGSWIQEKSNSYFDDFRKRDIPHLTREKYWQYIFQMKKKKKAISFNKKDWGLRKKILKEIKFT